MKRNSLVRSSLKRDDTTLSTITKEIEDVFDEQCKGSKQKKKKQVQSSGLGNLSQQEMEDLILQEQTTKSEDKKEKVFEESSVSETLARDWDIQMFDKCESWIAQEIQSNNETSDSTKVSTIPFQPQQPTNNGVETAKPTIYYDTTDVELLNSIEQAFSRERSPTSEESNSSSTSRSSSSMSNSTVDSVTHKI